MTYFETACFPWTGVPHLGQLAEPLNRQTAIINHAIRMAFQQPQRQQLLQRPAIHVHQQTLQVPTSIPRRSLIDESQEWILFSPGSEALSHIRTDSTARTPRTAGRSRLSELGSLDTAAASGRDYDDDDNDDHDNADLDSLDDGLHAFNEPTDYTSERRSPVDRMGSETVLPTHDGLGTFPGTSAPVQEQLWQHERYNPKRRRQSLRRSSLQRKFETLAEEDLERDVEGDRLRRIETWRLEQSRAILEEIERETRRRRRRESGMLSSSSHNLITTPNPTATSAGAAENAPSRTESFWARFTRRVIHNLMGIDDATLSVIFGEALATEESRSTAAQIIDDAEAAMNDTANILPGESASQGDGGSPWGERFFERIARELGVLVHQLREHPGAFSTYLRGAPEPPLPYAGLPHPSTRPVARPSLRPASAATSAAAVADVNFTPTLPARVLHRSTTTTTTTDPSVWGIDEADEADPCASPAAAVPALSPAAPAPAKGAGGTGVAAQASDPATRAYWERDLDASLVLGFLRDRLSTSPPGARAGAPRTHVAPLSPALSASHRVALIRHHHPLVSSRGQPQGVARPTVTAAAAAAMLARAGRSSASSCASASVGTRRSRDSRHYWDMMCGAGSVSVGSV